MAAPTRTPNPFNAFSSLPIPCPRTGAGLDPESPQYNGANLYQNAVDSANFRLVVTQNTTSMDLDAIEVRVLGCLIEKQRTTPDAYPLSLNALRLACNQSTNRDPVVQYDEE